MQLRDFVCLATFILLVLPIQAIAEPAAPTLTYSVNGFTVTASWTGIPGASEYKLSYAPNPYTGPDSISSLNVGDQTSFSATLWEGADFFIAVQAGDGQDFSEYSNVKSFSIASTIVNLSGNWAMTQTAGPNNCGLPIGKIDNYTIVAVHKDNSVSAQTPYATYSGNVTGNTATLSGSFQLDQAVQTDTLSLAILPDANKVSGSVSTTVTAAGFSCSATSSITGTR